MPGVVIVQANLRLLADMFCMHADDALVVTYQAFPPWGPHSAWNEVADASGTLTPVMITLDPGFSDHECREALRLYAPELTERCTKGKRQADGGFHVRSLPGLVHF